VLFAELDALTRNRPTVWEIQKGDDEALAWLGAACAAITHWGDAVGKVKLIGIETDLQSRENQISEAALPETDRATA
jgi:hypothetical protein